MDIRIIAPRSFLIVLLLHVMFMLGTHVLGRPTWQLLGCDYSSRDVRTYAYDNQFLFTDVNVVNKRLYTSHLLSLGGRIDHLQASNCFIDFYHNFNYCDYCNLSGYNYDYE